MIMTKIDKVNICKGVDFITVKDNRFVTSSISATIILPLDNKTASQNALLLQMLKHSCKEYPDFTALNRRLDELYGANINSVVTKIGDCQMLHLGISFIDDRFSLDKSSISSQCVKLLCSLLFQPDINNNSFDEKAIQLEKRCLIEEIQSEISEKRHYAINRCTQVMMPDEPAGLNRLGPIEQVQNVTAQDLYKTWCNIIKNANITFMLLGPSDPSDIIEFLKNKFADIKDRDVKELPKAIIKEAADKIKEQVDRMPVTQSKLVMGFRSTCAYPSKDVDAMKFMSMLFGGTPSSLLFKNVREKLSLCYYCAARYDRQKGIVLVDSGLEEKNSQLAKEEILRQLDRIKNGDFTDDDIQETRLAILTGMKMINDSQWSMQSWYINQLLDNKLVSPEESAKKIEAVTREDIIRAANMVKLDTIYLLAGQEDVQ